ncbi:MAG: peptidylprolyl isomerase, partial [Ignavibacteria bacterium]|nr:peptidylprolyl isomerase [Ignavibacteria bacterium]
MYLHKVTYISTIVVLMFNASFAQTIGQNIVAKIGAYEITEEEFLERFELTPQIKASITGISASLKNEVLYSLVAEKLWALEAEELRLTNSGLLQSTFKAIEKMFVRDALYREEILGKVNFSDEYLQEAFSRNSKTLQLYYLFSESKDEILQLHRKIKDGAYFESLLVQRSEFSLQDEPYSVNYGQMDKGVEASLYSMLPGEVSTPIQSPNGWYIFKLVSIEEKIISDSKQAEAEKKNVLTIASANVTDSIFKEFYEEFFSDVRAETNAELFFELAELVVKLINKRYDIGYKSVSKPYYLMPEDLYTIESDFGEKKLNAEFIRLNDELTTLDNFLQQLAFEKFSVDTLDSDLIKAKLNSFVKKFIEYELLAREGYKRGLQNKADVKKYLNMWRTYYLSEAFRKNLAEQISISDEEVNTYVGESLDANKLIIKIKILELLTEDLKIISNTINELERGADFRDLAVKYTIREEAKENNGEIGYFSLRDFGEIGRIAATMEIGEMYGPVQVPEGYSLFKVIDKKVETFPEESSFSSVKNKIKIELKYNKFSEEIIEKTVELANKYGVKVNQEILESIEVLNTTTV